MKYTTIIFDLDGTLLDTLEDLTDSVNYALKKYNYPTHTIDEVRYMVGSGIKVLIERAIPKGATNFDEVYQAFLDNYKINRTNKTKIITEEFMQRLVKLEKICHHFHLSLQSGCDETLKKMNVKMAIVSNKYQDGVTGICKPIFGKYIDVMIGEKPGIAKKPSKDMVMLAIKMLDADINKTIYVGDSDIDIFTANNSGIDCIGASWGFRGEAFLKEMKATYIAKKFSDIIDIVK